MSVHEEKTVKAMYEYMDIASVDAELICKICHSPFTEPQYTPCEETFCLECITKWIETQNSCYTCQESLSVNALTQANRTIRNMLDRIRVKCIACEQTELRRGTFADHVEKVCPKTIVFCSSADIKCPWAGQRVELDQHLLNCRFEPMRPGITQFITENKQLKEQVSQLITQITEQQDEIRQLKEQVNQHRTEITEHQNENQQLKDQINQQTTQIIETENRIRQLTEQVNQQRTQIKGHQDENQQLKNQINQQTTQISEKQNQIRQLTEQMNQQRTQIKGHQDENQQIKEQIVQLKTQINTCQRENQKLNASLTKEDSRIISINTQLRE